jgi:F-type H+-transporting ATPase subunit a
MESDIFSDPILGWLGVWPITRTMVTSAATSIVVILSAALVARAVTARPSGRLAAAGRIALRSLDNLIRDAAGRSSLALETFGGTLFLFISGAAVVGQLPGVVTPTSNVAATGALAVIVFLAVHVAGIHSRGPWGHLRHYFRPNPILFPLHIVSEISRTVALALRLFGNMLSGHLVVALILALVGFFVPVPLMVLDLLIGLLQAYIFTILASVYVGAAIRVGEEE